MLLKDAHAVAAQRIWAEHESRIASVLTELECITVLRRAARQQPDHAGQPWLRNKRMLLSVCLEAVSLKAIDSDVLDTIRQEERLGACRALDAIHVATALLFQAASEGPLIVCTRDQRMVDTCKAVGLQTLP